MSGVGKLYRVLRVGIRQRSGAGWKRPDVGDLINVSDEMGAKLVAAGYAQLASAPAAKPAPAVEPAPPAVEPETEPEPLVEPLSGAPATAPRCPEHPRYQGRGEPHRGCDACARLHAESHAHESRAHEDAR